MTVQGLPASTTGGKAPGGGREFAAGVVVLCAAAAGSVWAGAAVLAEARVEWTVAAASIAGWVAAIAWRARSLAPGPRGRTWGLANALTAGRGILLALLAGFAALPAPPQGWRAYAPFILYLLAILVDFADGYWARRTGTTSAFGEKLDTEVDALGILAALSLVVRFERLPVAFLAVGAARYAFVLGLTWRRRRGRAVYPLCPSYWRRRLAGFQMGVLAAFLLPFARFPAATLVESLVGLPLLACFLLDWMQVTGNLDPEDPSFRRVMRVLGRLAAGWFPLLLRGLAVTAAAVLVIRAAGGAGRASTPLAWAPAALPALLAAAYLPIRVAALGLLGAGVWVPAAAMTLLVLEGFRLFLAGLDWTGSLVITAALLLLLLGNGTKMLRAAAGASAR